MSNATHDATRLMAHRLMEGDKPMAAMALLRPMATEKHPVLLQEFARAALRANELGDALAAYEKLVTIRPEEGSAWIGLAQCYRADKRFDKAEAALAQAHQISTDPIELWLELGLLYQAMEKDREAEIAYREAIKRAPNHTTSWLNLGHAVKNQGRFEDAEEIWRAALAHGSNDPDLKLALAFLLLSQQRFDEGWQLFEARRKLPDLFPHHFPYADWTGDQDALQDKRVLIHAEQGLGDMVMMCRYLPLLAEKGAEIEVLCPRPLVPLIDRMSCVTRVSAQLHPETPPTMQIPALSLPRLFKTGLETWATETPLFPTNPDRTSALRKQLRDTGHPLIGVAWCGNPNHSNNHHRSLSPALVSQLAHAFPATWIGLHPTETPPEGIRDIRDHLGNLADAADLLAACDFVISVDTLWAHLSGSLGLPTWVLLPNRGRDWRWFEPRADSPWYPTMTLYQQAGVDDWKSTIDTLLRDLAASPLATNPSSR